MTFKKHGKEGYVKETWKDNSNWPPKDTKKWKYTYKSMCKFVWFYSN